MLFDDIEVEHRPGLLVQETQYDPWGLNLAGVDYNSPNIKSSNQYLFGSKEQQGELGLNLLDYGARMYDSTLGRFLASDPHADGYPLYSPYNYAFNNPILVVDPDGRDGRVSGTGTKDDPYIITANYYYYGLSKEAASGFNNAISAYNNEGKSSEIKTKDGSIFVSYNLSATEAKDEEEASQKAGLDVFAVGQQDFRFGNVVTAGHVNKEDALGEGGSRSITLDENRVTALQKKAPGKSLNEIYKATSIHEIGHNIGGVHNDPGTNMIQTNANEINK